MTDPVPPKTARGKTGKRRLVLAALLAIVLWFGVSEAVTRWWYTTNEAKLQRNLVPESGDEVVSRLRTFAESQGALGIKVEGVGDSAIEMLKCSFGETVSWETPGSFSAASVLKWDDRSAVGGTEVMHNPGNCLRSAGWTILDKATLGSKTFHGATAEVTSWDVEQSGMQMKAFIAVFRRFGDLDRSERDARRYWNASRLDSVIEGRRDAPLMILLVYLPLGFADSPSVAKERFESIMNAALAPAS
jgi:hypothetical protein